AHGVFALRGDRYAQTTLSRSLQRDVPGSVRDYLLFLGHPRQRERWSKLDRTVREGRTQSDFFAQLGHDRELGAAFDAGMSSLSLLGSEATLASFDFSRFGTIVDVGGGRGENLATILRTAPRSRGVLFDLPEVTRGVQRERMRVESGSFFERVPAGGDAYVLKHILHDWDDERARVILGAIKRAMPRHATLVIIESVVPADARQHMAKLIDLEMLVIDGKERSEREWRTLLAGCGFTLARITPTAGPVSVLEARLSDTSDA
ncbi:MAG TPA: methyltransferase, partial [Polyangiales bacterium]|nr:methyltransferase [Polyangiales bacterium]